MRALPNILCPFFRIMSEAKSQIGWWAALLARMLRHICIIAQTSPSSASTPILFLCRMAVRQHMRARVAGHDFRTQRATEPLSYWTELTGGHRDQQRLDCSNLQVGVHCNRRIWFADLRALGIDCFLSGTLSGLHSAKW